jgi:hypothetical protein
VVLSWLLHWTGGDAGLIEKASGLLRSSPAKSALIKGAPPPVVTPP